MAEILITGGAGFIGSHLTARLLTAGHGVRVLDCLSPQIHGTAQTAPDWLCSGPKLRFLQGSVTDPEAVRPALDGTDAVIHLAAETGTGQSMYEIARYTEVNTQGTAVLMQALADTSVQSVLLASSRSVYGEGAYLRASDGARLTPPSRSAADLEAHKWEPRCPATGEPLTLAPTHEDDRTCPASIYAATKLAQEDLVRITASSLGLTWGILRLQNVYGEGQSLQNPYTGILSIFSTLIRRDLPLPIYEDGQESRDFIHVSDVTRAFEAALAQPPNQVINVGSGQATSILEVATKLSHAFNVTPNLVITQQFRLGDIRHNCADISQLKAVLGITPHISLTEGLARFADWVQDQPLPEDQQGRATAELTSRKMMG